MVDYLTEIPLPGRSFAPPMRGAAARNGAVTLPAFVAGDENRLVAHTFGRLLAEAATVNGSNDSSPITPALIALFGPSGVGKTHLARGLVRHWQQQRGAEAAVYVGAADFRRHFHDAISRQAVDDFRDGFRGCQLLAIDDLHQLPANDHVSQELRYTIDACEESGTTLLVTSTRAATTLADLSPDVRSRLASGLLLQLAPPGSDARLRIIRQATTALGHPIADEASQRLATAVSGSAAEVFAALFEFLAAPAANGTSDLQRAERVISARAVRRPTLREIMAAVGKQCRLPQKQIKSSSRKQSAVFARELVAYLARELSRVSYDHIGRALGGRDHTTIMHNYRKIDHDRHHVPAIQETIDELRRGLANR